MRVIPPNQAVSGESARSVPAAYPMSGAVDLLGRMPVRLCAEGDDLVGYGFVGQRVVIPAAGIGAVLVHRGWGKQWGDSGPALLLLDKSERLLLRAPGVWNWGSARRLATINSSQWVDTDLNWLCASLRIGPPQYLRSRDVRQHKPLYRRAPGTGGSGCDLPATACCGSLWWRLPWCSPDSASPRACCWPARCRLPSVMSAT